MFTIIQFIEGHMNTLPTYYNWNTAFDKAIELESCSKQVNIIERNWNVNMNKMTTTLYFVKNQSIFRHDNKILPVYSHKKEFELAKEFKYRLTKMRNDVTDVYIRFLKESPYIHDEYHSLTVLEMFYKYEKLLKDEFVLSIRKDIFNKLYDLNIINQSLNIESPIDLSKVNTFDITELDSFCKFVDTKTYSTKSWIVTNCY